MHKRLFVLVFSLIVSNVFAYPIKVNSTGVDTVGRRLVYQIKEHINKSTSVYLAQDEDAVFILKIVTLDGNSRYPGNSTIYSLECAL